MGRERNARISLYYPFALSDLVAFRKCHDHDDSGEVMLVFEDTAHCHVTIRLHPACLKLLIQRLAAEPDNHPIGE